MYLVNFKSYSNTVGQCTRFLLWRTPRFGLPAIVWMRSRDRKWAWQPKNFRRANWTPLSKFLDPPLLITTRGFSSCTGVSVQLSPKVRYNALFVSDSFGLRALQLLVRLDLALLGSPQLLTQLLSAFGHQQIPVLRRLMQFAGEGPDLPFQSYDLLLQLSDSIIGRRFGSSDLVQLSIQVCQPALQLSFSRRHFDSCSSFTGLGRTSKCNGVVVPLSLKKVLIACAGYVTVLRLSSTDYWHFINWQRLNHYNYTLPWYIRRRAPLHTFTIKFKVYKNEVLLHDAQVDEATIMEQTSHRSTDGVRAYKRASEKLKELSANEWLPYLCMLITFSFASTRFLVCIANNHKVSN